ncbi:unnamed protein product [Vitrella brassicaformis CCMP3155]|uniref:Uncharacterized protein n=2 Tax=Vitrella brassicaformis TaxID=1169539 RepID=A0A0G4FWW9_VITBC|nr:unnamed protein product [Vitrella brassicaformis CCMP3155]|mmetsp:Transcript_47542/g.118822  ORF Transcript_47542/g.118822 Transcript_47542/m.118822 type:complete len:537 (+) Transcript_47542:61-1671(+)|eukprot:CEM19818.1 unnamed protein product [Vitrella brassicaformis CCMP3155]
MHHLRLVLCRCAFVLGGPRSPSAVRCEQTHEESGELADAHGEGEKELSYQLRVHSVKLALEGSGAGEVTRRFGHLWKARAKSESLVNADIDFSIRRVGWEQTADVAETEWWRATLKQQGNVGLTSLRHMEICIETKGSAKLISPPSPSEESSHPPGKSASEEKEESIEPRSQEHYRTGPLMEYKDSDFDQLPLFNAWQVAGARVHALLDVTGVLGSRTAVDDENSLVDAAKAGAKVRVSGRLYLRPRWASERRQDDRKTADKKGARRDGNTEGEVPSSDRESSRVWVDEGTVNSSLESVEKKMPMAARPIASELYMMVMKAIGEDDDTLEEMVELDRRTLCEQAHARSLLYLKQHPPANFHQLVDVSPWNAPFAVVRNVRESLQLAESSIASNAGLAGLLPTPELQWAFSHGLIDRVMSRADMKIAACTPPPTTQEHVDAIVESASTKVLHEYFPAYPICEHPLLTRVRNRAKQLLAAKKPPSLAWVALRQAAAIALMSAVPEEVREWLRANVGTPIPAYAPYGDQLDGDDGWVPT